MNIYKESIVYKQLMKVTVLKQLMNEIASIGKIFKITN